MRTDINDVGCSQKDSILPIAWISDSFSVISRGCSNLSSSCDHSYDISKMSILNSLHLRLLIYHYHPPHINVCDKHIMNGSASDITRLRHKTKPLSSLIWNLQTHFTANNVRMQKNRNLGIAIWFDGNTQKS